MYYCLAPFGGEDLTGIRKRIENYNPLESTRTALAHDLLLVRFREEKFNGAQLIDVLKDDRLITGDGLTVEELVKKIDSFF